MKRKFFLLVISILMFGCAQPAPVKKTKAVVFYPQLPERPRLQFLHSITKEDDLEKEGIKTRAALDEFLLGKKPKPRKVLGSPYDVGATKGKIYLLDKRFNKLLILDLEKRKIEALEDVRLGSLSQPSGIWITEDDTKYVADMGRKEVVVFDKDNKYLRSYGGKDLFDKPVDVAVHENRVIVCDMNKNQLFVLDRDSGELVRTIGKAGRDEGSLFKPTHVTPDHLGHIYVTDAFNYRVQKFDSEGNFLKSFGFQGDGPGAFSRPKGLDIDREGHLYVVDAAFENVQVFDDRSGRLLLFFGGPGAKPGSMYLPAGIHIDYDNKDFFSQFVDKDFRVKYLLYVTNRFGGHKLSVYGFGDWVGPPLPGEKK